MRVSVRLFAVLRERAGSDSLEIELPEGATVAQAMEALRSEPGMDEPLGRMAVAMAVNREYADPETTLAPGDELALVPPVSGGAGEGDARAGEGDARAGEVHARVADRALSLEDVTARVGRDAAGAVVTFQGTTRDVDSLDYEAYREMAEERIAAILRDCIREHDLEAAAAEHRIGSVALGEPSVIVAVSAAHRGEAFAGARAAIDRIKAEAPIWKREVEGGDATWVEGNPVEGAEAPSASEGASR
jgi:molybdopterin synthase catalytic subunit